MSGVTAMTHLRPATLLGWGYEGRSVEDLVTDAHTWGVAVVVDVRLNAISRRKGFSKRALAERLAEAGIGYVHLRGLGNPRENRAGFANVDGPAGDHARAHYRSTVLESEPGREALRALAGYDSAIVLCFEAHERCCHRALVLEAVRAQQDSEEARSRA